MTLYVGFLAAVGLVELAIFSIGVYDRGVAPTTRGIVSQPLGLGAAVGLLYRVSHGLQRAAATGFSGAATSPSGSSTPLHTLGRRSRLTAPFMRCKRPAPPVAASVDIIVACKGPGAALAATVQSVAGQTAPARLLVADGGSRDGTPDRLARWHDEGLVASWTSQPDQGIYDAWNRALDDVRSDWVMFLGAGDTLADTRVLADLAPEQAHAAAQDTRVVYGQAVLVDAAGTSIETWNRPWPEVASEFHAAMPILHSAVLHHRSLFTEHGRFDPTFSIAGDYEFLLRELPHRPAHSVDRPVVRLLDGGVSRDDRNARQVDTELLRIAHRHDLPQLRRHVRRRRAWRHLNTWLPAPLQGRLLARYRRRRRRRGVHRGDVL